MKPALARALLAVAAVASIFSPSPAQAQDAIEIRSDPNDTTRLSLTSGAAAEVRLFTTFNAQQSPLVGFPYAQWQGISTPDPAAAGYGRIFYSSLFGAFRMSEGGPFVPVGTVRQVLSGSGLAGGPITGSGTLAIATGGVTSVHIADGTIQLADLAPNGAGAGQTIKWSGTAWTPADDEVGTDDLPSGYCILGPTVTPPAGYWYTGDSLQNANADSWMTKAPLPAPRRGTGAAAVGDDLYVFGGGDLPNGVIAATTYKYDPVTDTWTTMAPMNVARYYLTAAEVNGKVYAIGGRKVSPLLSLSTVEMYDPGLNSWTFKAPLPTARFGLGAAVVGGKIYAIGGYSDISSEYLADNEVYTPDAGMGAWSTSPADMPTAREALAVAAVDGKIYAIGGFMGVGTGTNAVEAFDPAAGANGTWSGLTGSDPMPTARSSVAGAALDGRIYVLGGYNMLMSPAWLNTNQVFDPSKPPGQRWTTLTPAPTRGAYVTAAATAGRVYLIGGYTQWPAIQTLDRNEVYTPQVIYYVHRRM